GRLSLRLADTACDFFCAASATWTAQILINVTKVRLTILFAITFLVLMLPGTSVPICCASNSPSPAPEQNDLDRFKNYDRVQKQRLILDVIEIIAKLFNRIFDRSAVRIFDLSPPGEPRFHHVTLRIVGDDLAQLFDEHRAFRARPHEVHVSAQNVDELRQLVESKLADNSSDSCYSRVVF